MCTHPPARGAARVAWLRVGRAVSEQPGHGACSWQCAVLPALTPAASASRRIDSLQLPGMRRAGGGGSGLDERMRSADRGYLTCPPR